MSFIFTYVIAFSMFFFWIWVLSFHSQGLSLIFLLGMSASNKFCRFLFICECLNFTFILKIPLLDVEFLIDSFFFSFSTLNISSYCFWYPWFLMKNQLLILLSFKCKRQVTSLLLLSLFLAFNSSTVMSLGVDLFEFIPLATRWTSWICGLIICILYGKFSDIISFIFLYLSLLSFLDFHYEYIDMFNDVSEALFT